MYDREELSEAIATAARKIRLLTEQMLYAVDGHSRHALAKQVEELTDNLLDLAAQHAQPDETDLFDPQAAAFLSGDEGRPEAPAVIPEKPTT